VSVNTSTNGGVEHLRLQYRWYYMRLGQFHCARSFVVFHLSLEFLKSIFDANFRSLHLTWLTFNFVDDVLWSFSHDSQPESIIFEASDGGEQLSAVFDRPEVNSKSAMLHLLFLKTEVRIPLVLNLDKNTSF
jgi:hypothetical protein